MSETLFAHGDFKAPCLVWRSGDDVEVTLTAVRPDDVAALMHTMKTVCGSRECRLIMGGVETQMMCLRVDGRERRHTIAGGVEFVLGLRTLPRLDVAVCGETCGTLTCTEPKGHAGQHRDGRAPNCYPWSQADCDRKPAAPPEWNTIKIGGVPAPAPVDFRYRYTTTTRPLPHPGTAVEALTRFVIGVDLAAPHASGCLVRAAEERRQPCDGCAAPPEGKGFTEWRHADNCPHVLAAARDAEIDAATEREMAAAYRREQEAPLVALVAAVPEGLDPIGWRAAAISTDEAFVRMPADVRPDPGGWGWRLERTIRGDRVLASEGTWMHAALSNGRDAYRRALTRQPPPMRPGRVLACNAYDVPGQP